MSLSRADLRRQAKLGNKYARRVITLREKSHLSLSAILLANVAVISTTSLVIEHYNNGNGILAGVLSTLLIVIFGEVIPQAWFVRFALKFCAFFAPLVHITVFITYPVSKPLQLLLDQIVGYEPRRLHSRDELGLLIGEHATDRNSELDDDEIEIMQSALQLSDKQVAEIMRPIGDVYWLSSDAILDAKTVDEITDRGYSRIPIFDRQLSICMGVLLMKDLVDIDFDSRPQPIRNFHLHPTRLVGSRTALDTLLRKFFVSHAHLMPVERDDRIIGIVTIEDLIEEIIGHEIIDETDHARSRV